MKKPLVSVVMGSDSDIPVMKEAIDVLHQFEISHEIFILSAHRCPDQTAEFAKRAIQRGIKVIIAGAGGAAHLAGIIAANTALPVIGIPVLSKSLSGIDSLYSTVQMPPGVPVATVAINGAKNAGLLAIQILALSMPKLQKKFANYKKDLGKSVISKSEELTRIGWQKYLKQKGI